MLISHQPAPRICLRDLGDHPEGPPVEHSVLPLYHALRTVQLDPTKVYKIREATLERDDFTSF